MSRVRFFILTIKNCLRLTTSLTRRLPRAFPDKVGNLTVGSRWKSQSRAHSRKLVSLELIIKCQYHSGGLTRNQRGKLRFSWSSMTMLMAFGPIVPTSKILICLKTRCSFAHYKYSIDQVWYWTNSSRSKETKFMQLSPTKNLTKL